LPFFTGKYQTFPCGQTNSETTALELHMCVPERQPESREESGQLL
jgi:hypothetical protein